MSSYVVSHLEQFLASVEGLPNELRGSLAQLRVWDLKQAVLGEQARGEESELMERGRRAAEKGQQLDRSLLQLVREKYRTLLSLSDKKIALASQAYATLDDTIRRLDAALRKFEAELEAQELNLTAAERRKRKASLSGVRPAEQRRMSSAAAAENKRSRSSQARTFDVALDMPIDPNEPTYCLCSRVAFGEMVGCDNPDCTREWFHFECVGLAAQPKGKWYCPECTVKRKLLEK